MSFSEFHYDLQASRILLQPIDDLSLRLDADLSFHGRGGNRYLSGDVIFAHAVYRGRVDYKSWLAQLRQKQAVPAESTWLGNTELNIHLTGSEPFLIENNLGRVSFWADHRLLGTISRPRLMGRLEVDQGQVFFRNHDFKVNSGSMDFIGLAGINPICDLKAETWTQGYSVRLTLDGPLDKLSLNLESTPPLIETDILALLTVGKISRDLKGLEGEVGAAEAASFLSGDIQDQVESKVTSVTGFDRFQFDPHMNQSQGSGKGAMAPRLTVGKRLFSDKLFVTYSSDISTSEGQAVSLEYQVAPGATVVGERDEMGNRGADVRLHFKFD
jgi:translocation and assembly module TamB